MLSAPRHQILSAHSPGSKCRMEIKDKTFYEHLVKIIKMEQTWQCRIPMNKR